MIVHASTFILSLLSMTVWVFSLVFKDNSTFRYANEIVYVFVKSLIQAMICFIFWNMDNIKFVPVPVEQITSDEEDTDNVIQVELIQQNDFNFQFQLRIWQQFMRDPSASIYRSTATYSESLVDGSVLT